MNCNVIKSEPYTEYCDNRKKCIAVELKHKKKVRYELINVLQKKICKIKIDGGYIKNNISNVKKCDYGFLICEDNHIILVELKGGHFIEAVKQINSTVKTMENEFKFLNVSVRIVLTKTDVPAVKNKPEFLKLKKIIKQKNGTIKYASKILKDIYDVGDKKF